MTRGNNVKRFEQAFSLEKRYIKTRHYWFAWGEVSQFEKPAKTSP
jgi:hypothetical protein